MEDFAFESNTLYSLEDIQVVDPTAVVETDGEFGPVVFAIKEPIEYVFYPDGEEWTLDHTWHGFWLTRRQGGEEE